jgi:hypothetical protein
MDGNTKEGGEMSKAELKAQIEKTAHETRIPVVRLITAMQGELARMGDENGLAALIDLKNDYAPAGLLYHL